MKAKSSIANRRSTTMVPPPPTMTSLFLWRQAVTATIRRSSGRRCRSSRRDHHRRCHPCSSRSSSAVPMGSSSAPIARYLTRKTTTTTTTINRTLFYSTTSSSTSTSSSHAGRRFDAVLRFVSSNTNNDGGTAATNTSTSLSSHGRRLELYNTLTGRIEPIPTPTAAAVTTTTTTATTPKTGGGEGLAWYTCGPTTYAPAHLGHARTYVIMDILRRVLTREEEEDGGSSTILTKPRSGRRRSPLFVVNITDIDDKILAASSAATKATNHLVNNDDNDIVQNKHDLPRPIQLARQFEAEFWRDWDALNCLRPHVVTRVTEHVESHIVPFIERLVNTNMAYKIEQDGVYFDVRSYNDQMGKWTKYGKLAPPAAALDVDMDSIILSQQSETTKSQKASPPPSSKKDPRDFVLWKTQKSDHDEAKDSISWPSPWGNGRPGWHIECSAMIQAVQEQFPHYQFLVHAGGVDLQFPHHTNEIAQSEAYLGNASGSNEWIPHWVHTGHLHIDGLKMSKSLKNFVTIQEFLENGGDDGLELPTAVDSMWHCRADDFRLWCLGLSGSYRGPATYSELRMAEAASVRQKIVTFLIDGEAWVQAAEASDSTKIWGEDSYALFETIHTSKQKSLDALQNDLDGSTFVAEVVRMAESGSAYLQNHRKDQGPVEVVISAMQEIRELLRLVGFTSKTMDAGRIEMMEGSNNTTTTRQNEAAVVDALVEFRSKVRTVALKLVRESTDIHVADELKSLLELSDTIRDITLPQCGIQLLDGKDEQGLGDSWKRCPPRSTKGNDSPVTKNYTATSTCSLDLHSVPLCEFFKVGQYENAFSNFTEDGIPTHNADGTEVSKRLLKKLLKKRDVHEQRLLAEGNNQNGPL